MVATAGLDLGVTMLYAQARPAGAPLAVALVLADGTVPRWVALLLEALRTASYLELSRAPAGLGTPPAGVAFAAYERACARDHAALDPGARVAAPGWVGALPQAPSVEARDAPLVDVVLNLSAHALPPGLARSARYGAWEYRCGAATAVASAACFDTLVRREPLTTLQLCAHVASPGATEALVLASGTYATTRTANVVANRLGPLWGSHHFALQKLCELRRDGWEAVRARAVRGARADGAATADAATRAAARAPRTFTLLRWAAKEGVARAARRVARTPTLTDWCVALRRYDRPLPERIPATAFDGARFLPNPRGHFYADPFLVAQGARTWLFVEDFAFDVGRGVLSCGEVARDGTVRELRPCLERAYHLSYPNVFWYEGSAWLVPESEQSGTVDLYRAVDFPYRWTHERTLLRMRCVDPTLLEHDGRWWLYATHVPCAGVDATTLLWHAPSPLGPWEPHPFGVVAVDVRRSRGAGRPFVHDGRLLRPAQDGARHYGHALVLNEVLRLTPEEHAERPFARYPAPPLCGVDGLHHYSRCGDWEAFDVRMQSPLRRFAERPVRDATGRALPFALAGEFTPRR